VKNVINYNGKCRATKNEESYENFVKETREQSIKANKLREDRNNILKELIQITKKKGDEKK